MHERHGVSGKPERRDVVAGAFDAASGYWEDVYGDTIVEAVVYQERRAVVERWLQHLPLARGARVLEVGPGAGLTTVELARRGYLVDAVDVSEPMLERVRSRARGAGVDGRVRAFAGDAAALAADDCAYALAVAVGLLPWVDDPAQTIRELARVVGPNGWVLLTADNRARLTFALDPALNPWLERPRAIARAARDTVRRRRSVRPVVLWRMDSRGFVDRLVTTSGLVILRSATLGFGPFTLLGKQVVPTHAGIRLHRSLQSLADRRVPVVRAMGSHYLVLAQKPPRP